MSRNNTTLKTVVLLANVLGCAIIVPLTVASIFPSTNVDSPLFVMAWLSIVGGLAGYGLYKL